MRQRQRAIEFKSMLVAARLAIAAAVIEVPFNGLAADTENRVVVGSVIDDQGKPVTAAQLCWKIRYTPDDQDSFVVGTTDNNGKFHLEAPLAWKPERPSREVNMLWVLARGHSLAVVRATPDPGSPAREGELVIRLAPAGDTSFRVFNSRGVPLDGVVVEPWHFLSPNNAFDVIPKTIRDGLRAKTDDSGTVEMETMPREGFLTVQLTDETFGSQQVQLDPRKSAPAERLITLRETGRVEGRFIADKPEWTRGIRMSLTTTAAPRNLHGNVAADSEGTASTVTDDDGRFVVPAIASGKLRIDAVVGRESPFLPRLPENVEVQPGAVSEVEILMVEGVRVRGLIRTEDTRDPVPGAEIHIYYGVQRQGANVVSDAAGRFEALALPGRVSAQVIVLPAEFGASYQQAGGPWSIRQQMPADASEFEMQPIVLSLTATIEGKLLDHRGRAVAKMRLNGLVGARRYGFCETNEEGRFVMRVPRQIALDSYQVWVDVETPQVPVIEQESPLILRLKAPPDSDD